MDRPAFVSRPIERLIVARHDKVHVRADTGERRGQRRTDIGEPSRLGQREHLGRCKQDTQACQLRGFQASAHSCRPTTRRAWFCGDHSVLLKLLTVRLDGRSALCLIVDRIDLNGLPIDIFPIEKSRDSQSHPRADSIFIL